MSSNRSTDERQIVSERIFTASPEAVFDAFADPKQLTCWWGPKGFTSTIDEFDFRPGGAWRLVLHGPDGADYPNEKQFVEIVRPERIVFDHFQSRHLFRMTMGFVRAGMETRLVWRMLFESAADCENVRTLISEANEQNFDRLADHLRGRAFCGRGCMDTA